MQLCGFLQQTLLVESRLNTSIHQSALSCTSELLIHLTSQTFLRKSNTDFVEKVIKAFSSTDIHLYKLNIKPIKNLFHDIDHKVPSETSCRKTVLLLGADELHRLRMLYTTSQFFCSLMRALYLAYNIKYFCWKPRNTSGQLFVRMSTSTTCTKLQKHCSSC